VGVVFAVGAAEWGTATGAIGGVVLATSPEWVKWATTARTDATFACFLTVAFLLAERWLRSGEDRWLVAFAAAAGAATLAKGFAAAGLLVLVFAIEMWRRSERRWPRPEALGAAALVFGAIAVSWYAAALWKAGFAFFHKQIVLENVLRFLPNAEGGPSRKHALLFYVPMLLTGMLPWSVALPAALVRAFRERRTATGDSAFPGYLLTWFAVVFVVCTLASGKRTNYVLPLYPAAALLIGRELGVALANARAGVPCRALRAAGYAGAVLILAFAAVLAAWSFGREPWTPALHWLHAQDQILLPRMAVIIGAPPIWTVALVGLLGAGLAAATARVRDRRGGGRDRGPRRLSLRSRARGRDQIVRAVLAASRHDGRRRAARLLSDVRLRDALLSPPPRPRGGSSRVCRASAAELRARLRPRLGSTVRRGARRRGSRR
jgi:4-amino-4-deoxy-L-arabinose transferase-like glycosyltransferase